MAIRHFFKLEGVRLPVTVSGSALEPWNIGRGFGVL